MVINLCIPYSIKILLLLLLCLMKWHMFFYGNPQPQPCIYVVIILTVFYFWNKRRFESFILSMGRMQGGESGDSRI